MSKKKNKQYYENNTSGDNKSSYDGGAKKKKGADIKLILKIVLVAVLVGVLLLGWVKGWIGVDDDGRFYLLRNPLKNTANTVNTADPVGPSGGGEENDGPKHYTSDILDSLENTEIFSSTALEHIFLGNVNSSNKGSGYHYNMIDDSPGKIIEGTESEPDSNGVYTANITVNGKKKDNYSTFYPDSWSPQQVVDAINEAREEALRTGKKDGSYYVGHGGGLRINLYLDNSKKVVTAFPIINGK